MRMCTGIKFFWDNNQNIVPCLTVQSGKRISLAVNNYWEDEQKEKASLVFSKGVEKWQKTSDCLRGGTEMVHKWGARIVNDMRHRTAVVLAQLTANGSILDQKKLKNVKTPQFCLWLMKCTRRVYCKIHCNLCFLNCYITHSKYV